MDELASPLFHKTPMHWRILSSVFMNKNTYLMPRCFIQTCRTAPPLPLKILKAFLHFQRKDCWRMMGVEIHRGLSLDQIYSFLLDLFNLEIFVVCLYYILGGKRRRIFWPKWQHCQTQLSLRQWWINSHGLVCLFSICVLAVEPGKSVESIFCNETNND